MIYAPIIIPTCNRITHLKRCVESLARSPWAKYTELYISQDYPPEKRFFEGYEDVYQYLDSGIKGFKQVYVFHQKNNLGPSENEAFLCKQVSQKHNCCIFTEDDNEFSPNYIEYMDKGLELFKGDSNIISLSAAEGLSYTISDNYVGSYIMRKRTSPYGMGWWLEKEKELEKEISQKLFNEIIHSTKLQRKIWNMNGSALTWIAHDLMGEIPAMRNKSGDLSSTVDYNRIIYCIVRDKYSVYPIIPMVRNWGYDGTGVNCIERRTTGEEVSRRIIDKSEHFEFWKETGQEKVQRKNDRCYAGFKSVSVKEIVRSMLIITGRRLLSDQWFEKYKTLIRKL